MKKLVLALFAFISLAFGQIAVPVPMPHVQFLDVNGHPLSGGFVYTYAAGTTTPLSSYQDSIGTANTNPIVLDAGGFADIWIGNSAYKFVVQDLNGVPQWTADNVSGYFGLLNTANAWTLPQTFNQQISDLFTDNQFIVGAFGNQTTIDFPPPAGYITLHFPNTSDTIVGRATIDNLTNKTLTGAIINQPILGGCTVINGPATYDCLPNQSPTGTTANLLAKLVNTPTSQAVVTAAGDTSGAIGICVLTCGITGTAVIQQSGLAFCAFDGTTTAGDYVQISPSVIGHCTDAGAAYPKSGQVLGIVLTTNGIAQTYQILLFGPGIQSQPSPTLGVVFFGGTGAGTAPTINCLGGSTCIENGGIVQVVTGAAPATSSVVVTVAFGGIHLATNCTITPFGANAAALSGTSQVYAAGTGTSLAITSGTVALTAATVYNWNYTCNFK